MKTPRERVLSTATRLFYKYGINNVGIDEIVRQSGVTKMTLYKHYRSKDVLVSAFLQEIYNQWSGWFTGRVSQLSERATRPEDRVLAIFDALEEWFGSSGFRGCPFINTVAELSDRHHPARHVAVSFKQKLLELIDAALQPLPHKSDDLAVQLLLLMDGAIVRATMIDSPVPARIAKDAAARLIGAKNRQLTPHRKQTQNSRRDGRAGKVT